MLKRKRIQLSILWLVTLLFASCVKDVDFDQAEDVVLTPVIASSVVYTDVEASRFSENGMELETVSDTIANIEIFTDDFVLDNFKINHGDLALKGKQRIYTQFVIDKTGRVKNIRVRAPHIALENEVKRVISLLPQFIPGKHDGEHVEITL